MKTEKSIIEETIADCPLLYDMVGRPATETCMCFGWEHGNGWNKITSELSRQLETVNDYFHPKFRLRIQADQIKEKYGEYRFYYSIIQDSNSLMTFVSKAFRKLSEYLNNYKRFDYRTKLVTDVEPYDYDEVNEITADRFKEITDPDFKGVRCSNVDYVEKDGKYLEIVHLRNYGKKHIEPTRHKLLWMIKNFSDMTYRRTRGSFKDNAKIRNARSVMSGIAEMLIRNAEKQCSETCEQCGSQIGTRWSPMCQTVGWISCLCPSCAEKSNVEYIKDGEHWIGNKKIEKKRKAKR